MIFAATRANNLKENNLMSTQCNWGDLIFYGLIFLFFVLGLMSLLVLLNQYISAIKRYGWHTKKLSTEWMPYSAGTMVIIFSVAIMFGSYKFIYKLGLYLLSIIEKC